MQQGKTPIHRQNNPYPKHIRDTCYHCNGRAHKSNVCPTRRVVAIAEERVKEEKKRKGYLVENNEYADVEFAREEFDERVNFMLQRILLASKDEGQRTNMVKTHCSIKNKVCNLIVDNGSIENLVSQNSVDYLKLSIELHEKPHTLGWVNNGSKLRVTLPSRVPISIGKHYREDAIYDIIDMDVFHILLGRPL